MTPEEKAKEIVHKMNNVDLNCENESMCMLYPHAIECVLIAVDEILNEYPSQCPKDSYEMERHLYWIEVKKEIEKLKLKL